MYNFREGTYYIATVRHGEVRMYKGIFYISVGKVVMDRSKIPDSQQIGLELFAQIPPEKFLLSAGETEEQAWEKFIAKQKEKINTNIQATDQIIQWKNYAERQLGKGKRKELITQFLLQRDYKSEPTDKLAAELERYLEGHLK